MTQADLVVSANPPGLSMRTEQNTFFEALATLSSGPTVPSTSYPGQLWIDTVNNLLMQRNQANDGNLTIGVIDKDGWIPTNAGSPSGSLTPNFKGQCAYDTTNNLLYYADGLTNTDWLQIASSEDVVVQLPASYQDTRFEWVDATSIKILAGSRVRSSDDTTDIIFSSDTTVDITVSGAGGLDTGSEAADTWYYVYAIYNPTSDTENLVFSTTNEANTGSITLPSGYTKKRQLKIAVRNDSSSDILPFKYLSETAEIKYLVEFYSGSATAWTGNITRVLTAGASTTLALVDCSAFVPEISTYANFNGRFTTATSWALSNSTSNHKPRAGQANANEYMDCTLTSSQGVYYQINGGTLTLEIEGFKITEVI